MKTVPAQTDCAAFVTSPRGACLCNEANSRVAELWPGSLDENDASPLQQRSAGNGRIQKPAKSATAGGTRAGLAPARSIHPSNVVTSHGRASSRFSQPPIGPTFACTTYAT